MTSSRFRPLRRAAALLLGLAGVWLPAGITTVQGQPARILAELSTGERNQLETIATLAPDELERLHRVAAPDELERDTRALLSAAALNPAARDLDADGRSALHRELLRRLQDLAPDGVEWLGALRGEAPVPVALHRRRDPVHREAAATLRLGDETVRLDPLWPNGPMPSIAPSGGLVGPLVDAGDGTWEALHGLPLAGAIALMDFRGARNWERLFSLGALAVIVVEDEIVSREAAERLFAHTPIPCPRYYVDRITGRRLRAALAAAEAPPQVTVTGGAVYENRPWETHFAYLPPTAPEVHTVAAGELLERVASDYGLTAAQLASASRLADPAAPLAPGTILAVPSSEARYEVRPLDLWERIAAAHGLTPGALRAANPDAPVDLPPGTKLTLPAVEEPLVVIVPIDAMSVVPDLPHGALRAANLAATLRWLEHLARASRAPRRKGLLLVFADADTLGGEGARTFAEYALRAQERFTPLDRFDARDDLPQRERALAWFAAASAAEARDRLRLLPPAHAAWLGHDWLTPRVEERRLELVEARIAASALLRQQTDPEALPYATQAVNEADARLRRLLALRDATLAAPGLPWPERLARFRDALTAPGNPDTLDTLGVTWDGLARRLAQEHAEAERRRADHENNLRVVRSVLVRLHPGYATGATAPRLAWYLDLSDGSATLGITHARGADARTPSPAAANPATLGLLESRFRQLAAAATIRAGWTEPWPFATDADRREFPQLPVLPPLTYADLWAAADLAVLPLGTLNDRLTRMDTPRDVPEHTDFVRLATQARTAFVVLQTGLERPADSPAPTRLQRPRYGRLAGRALRFNLRSGIDASEPVPQALVYTPAGKLTESASPHNTSTYRGARRGLARLTAADGVYRLPLENTQFRTLNHLGAYRLDRARGHFTQVLNHGQVGTRRQEVTFSLQPDRETEKNLVLADLHPLVIFADTDPYSHRVIGGERDRKLRQSFRLIDAVLQGEPAHFAVDNPSLHYNERDLASTIVYAPPGRSLRVVVEEKALFKLLLTGPVTDGVGAGYRVGPGAGGERNVALPLTPLHTARDFLAMARHRLELFARHGITSRPLDASLERAAAKVAAAEQAAAERDWAAATGHAREAWGMMIKAYPRLLWLGRESVLSVVLLMALLLPACVFFERLVLGGRGLVPRLLGITLCFTAGTLFLNAFHPAFRVAVSPFIVVIAFTMILMSGLVLVLCYRRFEQLLGALRRSQGEYRTESAGQVDSVKTALSLALANLRRRPVRTALTTLTVATLTFATVSFVSITRRDAWRFRAEPLDPEIEGRLVTPEPPAYEGVLFRKFNWYEYGTQDFATMRSEFPAPHETTTRGFYVEVEGGTAADREGVNQLPVARDGRTVVQTAVMTFEPNEPRFSGLDRAVSGRTWFEPGDRFHVILPESAARELGITRDDLLDPSGRRRPDDQLPTVQFLNHTWRVIGLLDTAHADRIRDVNGKSLALVDHLRSAMARNATGDSPLTESPSVHFSWSRLLLVPQRAAGDIQAKPRALAVRFADGSDTARLLDDLALRLNQSFFVHAGGRLGLLAPTEQRDLAGLARVIVPVLLCVLVVLNTMMAAVDERRGEVGMLAAIGLSPRQIALLLLSEASVFTVLGLVLGLFAGLGLANAVPWLEGYGLTLFTGLSLNFASFTALALAGVTGAVVLAATWIPARRAATQATPSGLEAWVLPAGDADGRIRFDLPFTLTRDHRAGIMAFLRAFFAQHSEPTSAEFTCRHVQLTATDDRTTLACSLWLAPYDLDVAMEFSLVVSPSTTPGLDRVALELVRRSGTEEAWLRTTYAFLHLVRAQFLQWRNLPPAVRARFAAEGRAPAASTSA